jgi:hypothetical protein
MKEGSQNQTRCFDQVAVNHGWSAEDQKKFAFSFRVVESFAQSHDRFYQPLCPAAPESLEEFFSQAKTRGRITSGVEEYQFKVYTEVQVNEDKHDQKDKHKHKQTTLAVQVIYKEDIGSIPWVAFLEGNGHHEPHMPCTKWACWSRFCSDPDNEDNPNPICVDSVFCLSAPPYIGYPLTFPSSLYLGFDGVGMNPSLGQPHVPDDSDY